MLIKGVRYRRQQSTSLAHCTTVTTSDQAATKLNSLKTLQLLKVERKLFYLGFTHTTVNDVNIRKCTKCATYCDIPMK